MKKYLIFPLLLITFVSACTKENPQRETTTTTLSSQSFSLDDRLTQLKKVGQSMRKEHQKLDKTFFIADYFGNADSIEALTEISDLGIMGIAVEAEPYSFQTDESLNTQLTKVTVEVTQILHGDRNLVNQKIDIYELGGVVSPSGLTAPGESKQNESKDQKNSVLSTANGVDNSYPGDELIAYLVKSPGSDFGLETDVYQPAMGELTRFIKNDLTGRYERADTHQHTDLNDYQVEITKINDEINRIITTK